MRRSAAKLRRGPVEPEAGEVRAETPAASSTLSAGRRDSRAGPTRALEAAYAPAPRSSTITARRFWDQHEMSLHTATGRSLPYETVRIRFAPMPRVAM